MKLTGRTILITGGSAGIGLAFALKFLELGNEVIVTGRRQAALDQVKSKYPKLHTIQSDVADPAQIAALAARVKSDFPRLDVLMNNAGIMLYKNLKSRAADLTGLMTEMNINVGGVIGTTSALIDVLTSNKGTVINVSSGLAFVPLPAAPIYSATKAAIHSYTQSLRFQLEEMSPDGKTLTAYAVNSDTLPKTVRTSAAVRKLLRQNLANPKLYVDDRSSSSSSDSAARLQRLDEIEHRLRVPRHLDAAPLLGELAVRVDHERAALDSADFFAVHVFHLDDAELTADFFFGVG